MPYISLNLFRTSLRKQEQRQPTLSVSFFPSATAPALHLTASHRGWKPKADSVVGASRKACCELVKCPSGTGRARSSWEGDEESGRFAVRGRGSGASFKNGPVFGSCGLFRCPVHSLHGGSRDYLTIIRQSNLGVSCAALPLHRTHRSDRCALLPRDGPIGAEGSTKYYQVLKDQP